YFRCRAYNLKIKLLNIFQNDEVIPPQAGRRCHEKPMLVSLIDDKNLNDNFFMSTINLISKIPGPKSEAILERRKNALPAGLAKSTEVVVARAEGGVVWDVDGNTLLDFAGGIGMINVGHRPEAIVNAIKDQLDKYIHTCSLVTTFEPYVQLADM